MSSATDSLPPVTLPKFKVDSTYGAALIGVLLAAILYGVNGLQTYIFLSYYRDRGLRIAVCFLWLMDTLHLAVIADTIYFFVITNFGDPTVILRDTTWSITGYYLTTGIMEACIRGIFAYRIWIFSEGNKPLAASIVAASLVNFVGNLAVIVRTRQIHNPADNSPIAWIIYMAFSGSVVADLIIAISLCILLWKRRTGFPRTDSVIRVLILYSINTGALTSLCAILVLILFATMPNNFIYVVFYYILPKLNLNALLAMLNARRNLRARAQATPSAPLSIPLSSMSTGHFVGGSDPTSNSSEAVDIQIIKTIEKRMDADSEALYFKKLDSESERLEESVDHRAGGSSSTYLV